ncbi:MAG: SRPBCC family protein [Deinococcota bacterium]
MTVIKETITINASKEAVWHVLADFGNVATFNPNLKNSYSTSAQAGGVGATRVCHLKPMGEVEERITAWREAEYLQVYTLGTKGMPSFKHFVGEFKLEQVGSQSHPQTQVMMTFRYELSGLLGGLINQVMMKRQFQILSPKVLQGLKHYVETGHKATPADLKQMRLATLASA